jgi:hypothetical protein
VVYQRGENMISFQQHGHLAFNVVNLINLLTFQRGQRAVVYQRGENMLSFQQHGQLAFNVVNLINLLTFQRGQRAAFPFLPI